MSFFRTLKNSKYLHYLFIALFLYSISAIFSRILLADLKIDPYAYIAFVHLFLMINFLSFTGISEKGFKCVPQGFRDTGWIILPIAFLTIGYRLSEIFAVQNAYVGLAIAVKHSSVLFMTIIGGELFHESYLARKWLAVFVMACGVALIMFT